MEFETRMLIDIILRNTVICYTENTRKNVWEKCIQEMLQ